MMTTTASYPAGSVAWCEDVSLVTFVDKPVVHVTARLSRAVRAQDSAMRAERLAPPGWTERCVLAASSSSHS